MTRELTSYRFGDASDKPSMLIAHGLFGSARNWRTIAKNLSTDRQVITVDMRNHASSFWDNHQDYHAMADDLEKTLAQMSGPVDVMGHSMGGKAAMVLAMRNPISLKRLIVVDIAPVAYGHAQEQIENVTAMLNMDIDHIKRRSEAENLLIEANPGLDMATRAFLVQSLEISKGGNRWKLNLDILAKNMDSIIGFPKFQHQCNHPVLFIKGGMSEYILPKHHETIKTLFPKARIREIAGAGHWVHAEAPKAFLQVVSDFLAAAH